MFKKSQKNAYALKNSKKKYQMIKAKTENPETKFNFEIECVIKHPIWPKMTRKRKRI